MIKLSFAIPKDLDAMSLDELDKYVSQIAAMGYAAVEPLINDPSHVDILGVQAIMKKHGIHISGEVTPKS